MITLNLIKKNLEEDPIVLNLTEEDWEFSLRLGTIGYNDNLLTVSNVNKHLNDSENIIEFFNTLKNIDRSIIDKVTLEINGLQMFDSNDLNLYYYNIFIQYIYTMSQATIDRGNYGLSIFLGFSTVNPETGETENIILRDSNEFEENVLENENEEEES